MEAIDNSTICICGRLAVKVHCPICGSQVVLAFARREQVMGENGEVRNRSVFRCRRCNNIFNDDEWRVNCRAPHIRTTRAQHDPSDDQHKPIHTSREDLSANQLDAIRRLRKSRGLDPDDF